MKKEINLAWTRDFTLPWAEWWTKYMNPRLIEVFGVGVDSQLSFFNGQLLETYRTVKESRDFINGVVNIDPKSGFFGRDKIEHYKFLITEIRNLIKELEKNERLSDKDSFEKIKSLSSEMYPWYTVSYLLPQEHWASQLVSKYPDQAQEILDRLIDARKQSEGAIEELVEYWRAVAKELLVSRNLSFKYNSFLTFTEIEKMLDDKLFVPNIEELEARLVHYIFFKDRVYTNISLDNFLEKNDFSYQRIVFDDKVHKFTGVVAAKGGRSIKGIVQIIFKNDEVNNFKPGNVLVSVMTNPYFIPAMKNAIAIVTDEGGITCHAAIVSRELRVPCIIGTKIATRVLKDGDLVEVDAERGIVRIFKKNNE
jgi:phosphohistidine swiveling domain-containing protein